MGAPLSEHEKWDEMLAGYVLNALEPAEQEDFETHLQGCDECQAEVDQLAYITADLARALPAAPALPGGRERLMAAIHAESAEAGLPSQPPELPAEPVATRPTTPISSVPPAPVSASAEPVAADELAQRRDRKARPERRWQLTAAAAALVVIAAGGYGLSQHRAADRRSDQLAAAEQVLQGVATGRTVALQPSESAGENSARAGVVQQGRTVTFAAKGLTPNDTDASIYVLWASNSQDKMVAVATFDAKEGQIADVVGAKLPTSVAIKPIYAVSLEKGRTAPPAPSNPVLSTPI
jgi:hypothetical protein